MAAADHASCHSRRLESQVRMEMVELRTLSTILFLVEWRESSTEPPKVKSLGNSYATVTYMCLTPRNGYESFFKSPLEETSCSVQSLRYLTLCDPMNHSTPGLSVHHQPPEFTQIHAH